MPARRKSLKLHQLHSTVPHDRTPDTDSQIVGGFPRIPPDVERGRFKRICGQLSKRGTLTAGDVEIVRLLCVVSERHERALKKLKAEGEVVTYSKVSPTGAEYTSEAPSHWLKIAENAERMTLSCLDRLGLTPASREKIKPTKPSADSAPVLPGSMAELFPHLYPELHVVGAAPKQTSEPAPEIMPAPLEFEPEDNL